MTREELWQLQSIQHKLERLRQRELADSGDTFKSTIWRSQSHGEVVAYDNALVLINGFLKGNAKCEIMKTAELVEYRTEVEQGDTIWSLCAKVASDEDCMEELVYRTMQENHIKDPANLQPGQLIIIHVKEVK